MAIDAWIINARIKADKWRSRQRSILNKQRQTSMSRGKITEQAQTAAGDANENDDGTKEMEKAAAILNFIHDLDDIGHTDVRATVIAYNTLLSGMFLLYF